MTHTHGFVEVDVAKLLDIPYDEYVESDSKAAIIPIRDLNRYHKAVHQIHIARNDPSIITPKIIPSNTAGIAMVLTKYCTDDNFMDDFTPGQTKESREYLSIVSLGNASNRFAKDVFLNDLKGVYEKAPTENPTGGGVAPLDTIAVTTETTGLTPPNPEAAPQPIVEEVLPEPVKSAEEIEAEKVEKAIDDIIRIIRETAGTTYKRVETFDNGKHLIRRNQITDEMSLIKKKYISDLSEKLDKHIFIIGAPGVNLGKILKLENRDVITKHIIIIIQNPKNHSSKFIRVDDSRQVVPHLCLGHYAYSIFTPLATNTTGGASGSLSDYDAVFKDTVTNVMFALRESFIVYLLISTSNSGNKTEMFETLFKEIGNRWKGDMDRKTLREIDLLYHKRISENNKDDYISFCKVNSNSYIKSIEKALSEAILDIGKLQKELFEKSKMYRQYHEIIDNFDKEKHAKKVEEDSMRNFEEVMSLPQINSVFVKENKIHVYTNDIYTTDPRSNKIHELGTYHIQLGMASSEYDPSNSVVIKNTKHRVVGFNNNYAEAPHIFDGGKMCHGNLVNSIVEHYKERDLYGIVMDLIIFLESVNVDDSAGRTIDQWPVVDKIPEPEVLKAEEKEEPKDEKEQAFDDELMNSLNKPILTRSPQTV